MEDTIRVGIVGYGNLGKGVEIALSQNKDFELEAIFTRRDPSKMKSQSKIVHISQIQDYKDKINVMILCGGSALDLPEQGPKIAENFNTVDSFDTHARIPKYFDAVDKAAKKAGTLSLISIGWDPGLFSLNRILAEAVLPNGKDYTFWGKGVSQGHSDAIRRISGVKSGVQYTVPVEKAIERVRSGENPELAVSEKHNRICYVVPEEGANVKKIEEEIKNMPNYFADYDTEVHFITEDILKAQHSGMPHGGFVIRTGTTSEGNNQRMEFSLNLSSNPQFTASVIVAYARAVYRLSKEGKKGAQTIFDIPLSYISTKSPEELRKELL
ncbi:diaminopimelate dehydrogenase [Clostridium botulinum]|uniref:Meso-diaminopimelate D-dehydrogenase n=1 Tax=Clostridium botulinum C/D str. DC5 TaxID=1443128 RepID=A0A0A0IEK7_CLOBO|nr:diaminopimelate dehydrogenase [Clostridium botulinum]KEI00191.1 cytochrome C2 [Clostridium botulinum C/D str. BKT75002]KEI09349.1 cytochrome C2 [Clostridium botulinum C/D str. BKT2873]KGM94663.1 cytochrome C2 [Clostridium botulinum D str. CCUG 7971]KGM99894.1 cytochrome C2 [Clostridium botulinum C/D str. DC5]KOC49401.1 cytochrome C2 [Clostridium botulinum]